MSEEENDLFPLSWLTQFGYCPRRCGLLAIDQAWVENEYTASGRSQHKRVHTARIDRRGTFMELCEQPVYSRSLGVSGKCDCLEAWEDPNGVPLPYGEKRYRLYPIEYKHGVVRDETEYHVQLCAQAICLEEQFHCAIPKGAIFYINAHRRDEVVLDQELRKLTYDLAVRIRQMLEKGEVPPAAYSAKCRKCSMITYCSPQLKQSAAGYCKKLWDYVLQEGEI